MSDISVAVAPIAVVNVTVATPAPIEISLSGTQGLSGPPGEQGLPGIQGLQGPEGVIQTFVYTQPAALSTWPIAHDLGRFPSVIVVNASGDLVEADVNYVDSNNILVSFSEPFAGSAYLN